MGPIEVISGSMFSGKSMELIRRLKNATYAKKKVLAIYPKQDTNPRGNEIVTYGRTADGTCVIVDDFPAYPIADSCEAMNLILKERPDVLGLDEAQFFGNDMVSLVEVVRDFKDFHIRQIIAGLDTDYEKKPFGPMPIFLALSTHAKKLAAVCFECGEPAHYTQRISGTGSQIMVGKEEYQARCIKCHYVFEPK